MSLRLALLVPAVMATALIPLPAHAADDTLGQSVQQLGRFPFRPDCDGNTQEIAACQWHQRNLDDASLQHLLGSSALLDQWRSPPSGGAASSGQVWRTPMQISGPWDGSQRGRGLTT